MYKLTANTLPLDIAPFVPLYEAVEGALGGRTMPSSRPFQAF